MLDCIKFLIYVCVWVVFLPNVMLFFILMSFGRYSQISPVSFMMQVKIFSVS